MYSFNVIINIINIVLHGFKSEVNSATIDFQDNNKTIWKFKVIQQDFEVIHGLSRIVKLIPDKLITALSICRLELPDPKDNGSYLINLIIELLEHYKNVHIKSINKFQSVADTRPIINRITGKFPINIIPSDYNNLDCTSIEKTVTTLKSKLQNIRVCLENRDYVKYNSEAQDILCLSQLIELWAQIFLDFIHPIIISIRRNQFTTILYSSIKLKTSEKLENLFHTLTNEYNLEELEMQIKHQNFDEIIPKNVFE